MMDIIIIYQSDEQIEGLTVAPASGHPTDGTDKMCLCRCETAPENVTILGRYEEVFADPEKKAIYDRIYPSHDEDGNVKPEKFGVFA